MATLASHALRHHCRVAKFRPTEGPSERHVSRAMMAWEPASFSPCLEYVCFSEKQTLSTNFYPSLSAKLRHCITSVRRRMDLHAVGTANVFVYYRYLKKARSAPARYGHGSAARQVDGIFIVQLNCPRTTMLLPFEKLTCDCWAKVQWGHDKFLSATVRTRVGPTTC
jgi:hypothetical protein